MDSISEPCGGCRKRNAELEDAHIETLEAEGRYRVADDLARALADRLAARHLEINRLRLALLRRARANLLLEIDRGGGTRGPVRPGQRPLSHLLDEIDVAIEGAA